MVSCFFAACRRCQCARRLPTNRYFPNPPGIDTAPKGSLAKGSWHAGGVTEGFTVGTSSKYQPMWKRESFLVNSEE